MDQTALQTSLILPSENLAIVGCAFRFPGASDRDALWRALISGQDMVSRVATDRFSQDVFEHPRRSEPGSSYTFAAGSLGDIAGFDAEFFGVSPREAMHMDPQQRMLLELAWETCEDAGIRPSNLRGSRCGVFLGISGVDYGYRRADDLDSIDATTMTGNTASIAANRLSYFFDLHGPSMAIDTACSSSLVAFHQACRSILSGDSSAALAGAVGLHLHPFAFIGFSKASMLSRRGSCTPFAADGDGYVRSEGGGLLLIKRHVDAIADGDRVLAVVLGSALNTDGRKKGLTVPNHVAQAELLCDVYERCGIAPDEIDYLEAHGTGTIVGDPLEARALGEALGSRRVPGHPLLIGSVKSNLGHMEVASGIAGLVKAMLCIEHRAIPPTIHLDRPNPNIDFVNWNLQPVTTPMPMDGSRRLVVGVSSFGFGGANAHVVLASPDRSPPRPTAAPSSLGLPPLLLSARTVPALQSLAGAMATHLESRLDQDLYDIAAASVFRREPLPQRLAVFATDREARVASLRHFAAGEPAAGLTTGQWLAGAVGPVFAYSGNGSQWVGMGRVLLEEDASFRAAIRLVDAAFMARGGFSILAALEMPADAQRLAATEVAQPLLFAVQVGLTLLLAEFGVTPVAVVGHSVGEVAAAWACGALSLEQAVAVIHIRSAHQGLTRGSGEMTAVALGEEDVRALIASLGLAERLWVAGLNSANSVTLAGSQDSLATCEATLAARSIWFRRLHLDYAFHSPAMDAIRVNLVAALADLAPGSGTIPFYSTVTGSALAGDALNAEYWWRNVREPVRFAEAITGLIESGFNCFVEVGPSPILRGYLHEAFRNAGGDGLVLPTLTREAADRAQIDRCFHQVLLSGIAYDWPRLFPRRARFVDLPRYPWEHERFWQETARDGLGLLARHKEHPLLGYRLQDDPLLWENHLDTSLYPDLADHAISGLAVFPAAGFVEMALAAAALWHPARTSDILGLEIAAPLLLEHDSSKTLRFAIDPSDGRFTIRGRIRPSDDAWLEHATGQIAEVAASQPARPVGQPTMGDPDADAHYRRTQAVGLDYGPTFRSIDQVWVDGEWATATLVTPASVEPDLARSHLHPTYLDAAFQLVADLLAPRSQTVAAPAFIPIRLEQLRLFQVGARVARVEAHLRRASSRTVLADFHLYDSAGKAVASVVGTRFRAAQLQRAASEHLRQIATVAIPRPHPRDTARSANGAAGDYAALAATLWHEPGRLASRARYLGEVEPLLDAMCAGFAQCALRVLEPEKIWFDPNLLLAAGVIAAEREPLLQCLLRMLTDDGVLDYAEGRWMWRDESLLPDPRDVWVSLMGDYPDHCGLIALAGRAGRSLPAILTGTLSPEQILVADADLAAIGPFGVEPGLKHSLAAMINALIGEIASRLPLGRRPRVIELIGEAPDAVCIAALLDPTPCDLVIAAPSRERHTELETLLRQRPAARVCVIDPVDPGSTRAELGGWFDIVLIGSGFAAGDTNVLLTQAGRMLAEGGVLVSCEQYPTRAHDLSFGLHSHWWSRAPWPTQTTLRAPEDWQALLSRRGFADVAITPDMTDATSGNYLVFARQGNVLPSIVADPFGDAGAGGPWCIMVDAAPDAAALGFALASALTARGQTVLRILQGDAYAGLTAPNGMVSLPLADRVAWQDFLNDLNARDLAPRGIIHIAGLDFGRDPEQRAVDAPARLRRQEQRAGALLAELQGCAATGQRRDHWVITAQAGVGLLPPEVRRGLADWHCVQDAPLWGLARVAMNEFPEQRVRWIDLAEWLEPPAAADALVEELLEPDAEDEVILFGSARFAPRFQVATSEHPNGEIASRQRRIYLDFSAPGPLKNLGWRGDDLPPPREGEVEIAVRAVGLNFRDVMYAMGLLPDEALENGFSGPTLGMELAGVVTAIGPGVTEIRVGAEVIAFAPSAFASRVITKAGAVVAKPNGWSFAAATTVPIAFFTAYYALVELARLREGERVLIHGAAGGVGLAALQIAKMLGAEVFATAGTPEKREIVGMLGADHVFDSRSLAFAEDILETTGGGGVDCVLNSLSGEAIDRSLRILRPFGRFLELGKRDFYENNRIGLRPFRNNIAYFGIDADQLMSERPELARRTFLALMSLFERQLLKPLPYHVFDASEVVDAFRYMQHSRQIGKIVVTIPPDFTPMAAIPRQDGVLRLRADGTYLVTGGLSGFGLRTAQWLVTKGARTLVLLSRRGETGEAVPRAALDELRSAGVTVHAPACDVTDRGALVAVLDRIGADLPPLRGVVHAAMVIEDALLNNADVAQLHRVFAPKILGALHLDALTRHLPLDFFVLYSSATTLFGSPGQGSYVAANMALEGLARDRRGQGLPATCIAWGPIADVGYLARHAEIRDALVARMGGQALHADEALTMLEQILIAGQSNLAILYLAWGVVGRHLPSSNAPKFHELAALGQEGTLGAEDNEDLRAWLDGLDASELQAAVTEILRQELAEILRLAPDKMDANRSVYDMGMDSLMGVELITALDARLGIALPLMAVSEGPTIARLTTRIVHQLRPTAVSDSEIEQEHLTAQVRLVVDQHGDTLDPELIQSLSEIESSQTGVAALPREPN